MNSLNLLSFPKKLLTGLLLVLSSLAAGNVNAQSALDLQACIDYTLDHHASTKIYLNQNVIAREQGKEMLANYLPQVNGSISIDDNIIRQTTIIPAGVFSPEDLEVQFGNQYSSTAILQLDQVIYDQSLITGLKANEPNMEIAHLQGEQNEESLIIQTAQAYYQVLATHQKLALLNENEQKFEEQLEVVKLQLEKGVAKQVDYDRIRVSLNNVRSQQVVLQTNGQIALNRLRFVMGLPQDAELELAEVELTDLDVSLPDLGLLDPGQNLNLQIQDQQLTLQEIDLQRKQASRIPTVSAYARYGAQAMGDEFGPSLQNLFDFSSIGLKVNVPIFSGMRRQSQIAQSRLNLENAHLNYQLTQENLNMQLQNAYTALASASASVEANRDNLALAKNVFDNSSLQYQKGVAPFSDLINSDYAYKEAQNNYINSIINYLNARLDYERANGSLNLYIQQL